MRVQILTIHISEFQHFEQKKYFYRILFLLKLCWPDHQIDERFAKYQLKSNECTNHIRVFQPTSSHGTFTPKFANFVEF